MPPWNFYYTLAILGNLCQSAVFTLFSQYLMVQLTIAHPISTNSTSLLPDLVYAFNKSLFESRNIFLYDIHYSMVFSFDETKRDIYLGFPAQATVIKILENIEKIVQNSHLDVFFKIDVFKNFAKLTGKPCTIESSLIKLETRPAIFFYKKILWHKYFLWNLQNF